MILIRAIQFIWLAIVEIASRMIPTRCIFLAGFIIFICICFSLRKK